MTPSLPDILLGNVAAISAPMPPEASGDYMAGRMGLMAMLSILGAQEAERGVDTRVWENAALRDVLASAAASADIPQADDLSWGALDRDITSIERECSPYSEDIYRKSRTWKGQALEAASKLVAPLL